MSYDYDSVESDRLNPSRVRMNKGAGSIYGAYLTMNRRIGSLQNIVFEEPTKITKGNMNGGMNGQSRRNSF